MALINIQQHLFEAGEEERGAKGLNKNFHLFQFHNFFFIIFCFLYFSFLFSFLFALLKEKGIKILIIMNKVKVKRNRSMEKSMPNKQEHYKL